MGWLGLELIVANVLPLIIAQERKILRGFVVCDTSSRSRKTCVRELK